MSLSELKGDVKLGENNSVADTGFPRRGRDNP